MNYIENKIRLLPESFDTRTFLATAAKQLGGWSPDEDSGADKAENADFYFPYQGRVISLENKNMEEDWLNQPSFLNLLQEEFLKTREALQKSGVSSLVGSMNEKSVKQTVWRNAIRKKFDKIIEKANKQLHRDCERATHGRHQRSDFGVIFLINDNNPIFTPHHFAYFLGHTGATLSNVDCVVFANTPKMMAQVRLVGGNLAPSLYWLDAYPNSPKGAPPSTLQSFVRELNTQWMVAIEKTCGISSGPENGVALTDITFGRPRLES